MSKKSETTAAVDVQGTDDPQILARGSYQSVVDVAQAIKENMEPRIIEVARGDVAKVGVLVAPAGVQVHSLKKFVDENRLVPERRSGEANLYRLQSLIDHVNRFKSKESALFARAAIEDNSIDATIKAYLDYHPAGEDVTKADNGKHTAIYEFPIAKDFAFWINQNGRLMEQSEFALFLEERVIEMASPDEDDKKQVENLSPKFAEPTDILMLSRDLELYSQETVKQAIKLSSGEKEVKFTCQHVDANGEPVKIPDFFVIRLALFEGGEPQRILVRLRYRKNGERLQWAYDLYRIDRTLETAFQEACEDVQAETGIPLFYGTAEYGGA